MKRFFKPFIQYKDGFSRKVSGTGIGLALARSLAELHEGNLIMDDSQKQNCFILSLPVKHEHTIAISKSEIKLKEDPKEEDPGQLQQKAALHCIDCGRIMLKCWLLLSDNCHLFIKY